MNSVELTKFSLDLPPSLIVLIGVDITITYFQLENKGFG